MMEELWRAVGELQGQARMIQWMVGLMWPAIIGGFTGIYIMLWRNNHNNKKSGG